MKNFLLVFIAICFSSCTWLKVSYDTKHYKHLIVNDSTKKAADTTIKRKYYKGDITKYDC